MKVYRSGIEFETQNKHKTNKTHKYEKASFPKNVFKMQT